MKQPNRNRKRRTLPKNQRHPSDIKNCPKEIWTKWLDEMEHIETMDWVGDLKEREWKNSPEYAKRKELAEKYRKKMS